MSMIVGRNMNTLLALDVARRHDENINGKFSYDLKLNQLS